MKAVIYCRVSTKEQTKNLSLPTQTKGCRDYCRRHGYAVAREFVEKGESAKSSTGRDLEPHQPAWLSCSCGIRGRRKWNGVPNAGELEPDSLLAQPNRGTPSCSVTLSGRPLAGFSELLPKRSLLGGLEHSTNSLSSTRQEFPVNIARYLSSLQYR